MFITPEHGGHEVATCLARRHAGRSSFDFFGCRGVDHVVVVGGDLLMQTLGSMREQVPVLVYRPPFCPRQSCDASATSSAIIYLVCKVATPSQPGGGGLTLNSAMRISYSAQKVVMSILFTFCGHEPSAASAPSQSCFR